MNAVALCAQQDAVLHPETLGLEGENLTGQTWLRVFDSGNELRSYVRNAADICEIWVLSCQDVAPINAAAACKADNPSRIVCLIADEQGGSLRSRAFQAGIDYVLDEPGLVRRYNARKAECGGASRISALPLPSPAGAQEQVSVRKSSGKRGFIFPIISGTGGCGKSTVAAMAALISANKGKRTILVDADLQFGDMTELLPGIPAVKLDDLVEGCVDVGKLAEVCSDQEVPLCLAAAPDKMESAEELAAGLPHLLLLLQDEFDMVICNTGSFWTEVHAVLLEHCSKALLLMEQRPSSIRACMRALDLYRRCNIALAPIVLGVNRTGRGCLYSGADIHAMFPEFQVVELSDGGDDVEQALFSQRAQVLLQSGNPLVESLSAVLQAIVPSYSEEDRGGGGPFAMSIASRSRGRRLETRRQSSRRRKEAVCPL